MYIKNPCCVYFFFFFFLLLTKTLVSTITSVLVEGWQTVRNIGTSHILLDTNIAKFKVKISIIILQLYKKSKDTTIIGPTTNFLRNKIYKYRTIWICNHVFDQSKQSSPSNPLTSGSANHIMTRVHGLNTSIVFLVHHVIRTTSDTMIGNGG